jgi:Tol biopolymer transport system component
VIRGAAICSAAALLLVVESGRATFGGNNGLIAFAEFGAADYEVSLGIKAISPSGGAELQLLPAGRDPEWSPDGKRLAFDTSVARPKIYLADADGSNVRPIGPTDAAAYAPSWSPDGNRLVFVLDDGIESNRSGIYVIDADGAALRRVRKARGLHLDAPTWSPNGKWIAFLGESGYARHSEMDIFVVHPNGSGARRLTRTGNDEGKPSWSPDSTRLVFARHHNHSGDIFVLTLRTGRQRGVVGGSGDDSDPVWSPDRTTIAFLRRDYVNDVSALYLARPNGDSVRPLATLSRAAAQLTWQPLR